MKKILVFLNLFIFLFVSITAQQINVASPDGKLNIGITLDTVINSRILYDNNLVFLISPISMQLKNGKTLGQNPILLKKEIKTIDRNLTIAVPTKASVVKDIGNELTVNFKDSYSLVFRVYNDGFAYRFKLNRPDTVEIVNEQAEFNFPDKSIVFFPEGTSFFCHFEPTYRTLPFDSIIDKMCVLPAVIQTSEHINVAITENDLFDYPCMFLQGVSRNSIKAVFPNAVLETEPYPQGWPNFVEKITKEADYIARTSGKRDFPWRTFIITPDDRKIVESQMIYKLNPQPVISTDWIKPGKVSWDWWNFNNVYGVDFESGVNTETYKYYVDFASSFGLEYIILDDDWSKSLYDITEPNLYLNLKELISYANSKNVGIILWNLWSTLDKDMEKILDLYSKWGIKGIKVDYMIRADQQMVNFYERTARETAKRHMVVDFHGAFKPNGLQGAYPNVLSFEGVKGMENSKWSRDITPEHDVTLPYLRMVAGPMDFTPGAMINAQKDIFNPVFTVPMSQGTRCHQLAMYIVYESPLQMLCDNPSNYMKEAECTKFISKIPVTWDETVVTDGKIGDYIVIARRKADIWYVGAMTDWTPRTIPLHLTFLPEGNYNIEIMEDGINASKQAIDYRHETDSISNSNLIKIDMAPGGGWAAIITKK